MNLGLRWDVYPPWIENDNRQSNFDESTGTFVVASDDAVVNGVEVGRYLQTYSKGDLGPRFGFAYDLTGDGKTMIRGGFGVFWNFTPGGTSSSKAQNPPFLQSTSLNADTDRLRHQPAAQGRPAAASGRRSEPAGGGHHAVDLRHQLPRRVRAPVEHQRAAVVLHELHAGSGLRRLAGPAHGHQGRPEPGAARRRGHRRERQSAVRQRSRPRFARLARCRARARSTTTRCW